MKNILFISICCFFLLNACQQTNIDVWEDDGNIALHFVQTAEEATGISRDFGQFALSVNDPVYGNDIREYWSKKDKETEIYGWPWPSFPGYWSYFMLNTQYALGDSSTYVQDTVSLVLTYSGVLQEEGFFYSLKQQAVGDAEMPPVDFVWDESVDGKNRFFFEGGAVYDTVRIVLKKPEGYQKMEYNIVVDSVDNIVAGIAEKNAQLCIVQNSFALPSGIIWNTDFFGEFSEEKHAFMQTVLHIKYDKNLDGLLKSYMWTSGAYEFIKYEIIKPLKDALEAYNAANPENPKSFTFPDIE